MGLERVVCARYGGEIQITVSGSTGDPDCGRGGGLQEYFREPDGRAAIDVHDVVRRATFDTNPEVAQLPSRVHGLRRRSMWRFGADRHVDGHRDGSRAAAPVHCARILRRVVARSDRPMTGPNPRRRGSGPVEDRPVSSAMPAAGARVSSTSYEVAPDSPLRNRNPRGAVIAIADTNRLTGRQHAQGVLMLRADSPHHAALLMRGDDGANDRLEVCRGEHVRERVEQLSDGGGTGTRAREVFNAGLALARSQRVGVDGREVEFFVGKCHVSNASYTVCVIRPTVSHECRCSAWSRICWRRLGRVLNSSLAK